MKNKSQIQEIGSQFMQTCGMRACDLIALKRTLNFHAELLHYHPRGCSLFREQDMALLPSSLNHLLSSLHVMTTAPDETALFLAAALANEILPSEEKYPLKELKTNPQLQMELVERTCPNHFTAEESDIENDHNFIIKKGI